MYVEKKLAITVIILTTIINAFFVYMLEMM